MYNVGYNTNALRILIPYRCVVVISASDAWPKVDQWALYADFGTAILCDTCVSLIAS